MKLKVWSILLVIAILVSNKALTQFSVRNSSHITFKTKETKDTVYLFTSGAIHRCNWTNCTNKGNFIFVSQFKPLGDEEDYLDYLFWRTHFEHPEYTDVFINKLIKRKNKDLIEL